MKNSNNKKNLKGDAVKVHCGLEEKELALSVLGFPPLMSITKFRAQDSPKQILQCIKQQTKVCVSLTVQSSQCKAANTANNWAIVPGVTKPNAEAATQTSEAFVSQSHTGKIFFPVSSSFTTKNLCKCFGK